MKIPEGMTQEEVLEAINDVARGLAHKYIFGYHTLEDMRQQAVCEALEGLDDYDPNRGATLKTFLWMRVNQRLSNFKRDNFQRPDKPCLNCPLKAYDPDYAKSTNQCTAYKDRVDCDPYRRWVKRNEEKKNVVSPIGMSEVIIDREKNMKVEQDIAEQLDYEHLVGLIDSKIPVHLRKAWVKMKSDIRMNKAEREKLLLAIQEIVSEIEYGV